MNSIKCKIRKVDQRSEGFLYIATGAGFLAEAIESASAGRKFTGERPIALVTDDIEKAEKEACFDIVLPHPDPAYSYRDKIAPLAMLPFEKTIFLDTDARLIAPADALFELISEFDFAAAHAPVRIPDGWCDEVVPSVFAEFNSGVLLFKRSEMQKRLVEKWLEIYDDVGQAWDQAALRSAVWHAQQQGLNIFALPPEANLRTTKPWIAGEGLEVFVVHGRVPTNEWQQLLEYLNGDILKFRTYEEWFRNNPTTGLRLKVDGKSQGKEYFHKKSYTSKIGKKIIEYVIRRLK